MFRVYEPPNGTLLKTYGHGKLYRVAHLLINTIVDQVIYTTSENCTSVIWGL